MPTSCRSLLTGMLALPAAAFAESFPVLRKASELHILATIPVDGDFMAFGFGSLWVAGGTRVARIDPATNAVVEIELDGARGAFRAPAVGEDAVWVASVGADIIYRVDPTTNAVTLRIPATMLDSEGSIAAGSASVWAMIRGDMTEQTLARFDAETGEILARIVLPAGGAGVIFADGAVWVTCPFKGEIFKIDPGTNAVTATISTGGWPRFLVADRGTIWILDQRGAVQRVDSASGALSTTIPLASPQRSGGDIAVGGGFVWVNVWGAPVIQIDPATDRLRTTYQGGAEFGDGVRYGAGSIWISGRKLFRIAPPDGLP